MTNPDYMLVMCKASCNMCSNDPCGNADHHLSCTFWAQKGECDKNPKYMLYNCATACNLCSFA